MLLEPLRRGLARQGYRAVNWRYPSLRGSIEMHAAQLAAKAKELDDDTAVERLHFVGHSMGAIVVRSALAMRRPRKLGRVVLLAPPNNGARLADLALRLFRRWPAAARELGSHPGSYVNGLAPAADLDCGNHRSVVGPCGLACIDPPARRARSHHAARPAYAAAALACNGAGGALPARRPLPARGHPLTPTGRLPGALAPHRGRESRKKNALGVEPNSPLVRQDVGF